MKTKFLLLFLVVLFSCNDGDFDIPAFEFTETVETCGEYVLYRTNSDKTEAIALSVASNFFKNEAGTDDSPVSSVNAITYRIFSEAIGANYFCQSIPPSEPDVTKELIATSATINVTTTYNSTNETYTHQIVITDLLFLDGEERIYFETFDFGTITISE
ncbi:MAG TPA: hypothetical protein VJ970_05930 [Flavobacteriaceae bacterium]|nr:hypothetical protein [Flavobacteriaceae bacterium]